MPNLAGSGAQDRNLALTGGLCPRAGNVAVLGLLDLTTNACAQTEPSVGGESSYGAIGSVAGSRVQKRRDCGHQLARLHRLAHRVGRPVRRMRRPTAAVDKSSRTTANRIRYAGYGSAQLLQSTENGRLSAIPHATVPPLAVARA